MLRNWCYFYSACINVGTTALPTYLTETHLTWEHEDNWHSNGEHKHTHTSIVGREGQDARTYTRTHNKHNGSSVDSCCNGRQETRRRGETAADAAGRRMRQLIRMEIAVTDNILSFSSLVRFPWNLDPLLFSTHHYSSLGLLLGLVRTTSTPILIRIGDIGQFRYEVRSTPFDLEIDLKSKIYIYGLVFYQSTQFRLFIRPRCGWTVVAQVLTPKLNCHQDASPVFHLRLCLGLLLGFGLSSQQELSSYQIW